MDEIWIDWLQITAGNPALASGRNPAKREG
jgi:hypothetical protein